MWDWLGLGALGVNVKAAVGYSIIAVAMIGFLHNLSAALWTASNLGPVGAIGNRESVPPETGWGGRARRGLHNYLENALIFGLLVIAAIVFEVQHTALGAGAIVFAVARAVYLPVYLIGIPIARTLVWMVSIAGLGMMVLALFSPETAAGPP